MQFCNRRGFLTQLVAGSAALAIAGRAGAAAPEAGKDRGCAACAYFTRTPGSDSGTCGYRDGRQVPADGGCGNFK